MKAAVLPAYGQKLELRDVRLDEPAAREVRVRIEATGVCHSDLHCIEGRLPVYKAPLVPGHEAAGTVVATGDGVTRVQPGDRVIVCWVAYCGECRNCLRGEPMYCTDMDGRYGVMRDGTSRIHSEEEVLVHGFDAATFAEEAILHENSVVKIGEDVPFEVAALFGCAVTTGLGSVFNVAQVQAGETVAVIGSGGVGLNLIQAAKVAGAAEIIAIDVVDSKLEAAVRFGATQTLNSAGERMFPRVKELSDGGVDYAFEAIGRFATQSDALRMIRKGGMVVFVGIAPLFEELRFSSGLLTLMGQRIAGTSMGGMVPDRDLPKFIDLWRSGQIEIEALIAHRGGLEDVNEAVEALQRGTELRTVLFPNR